MTKKDKPKNVRPHSFRLDSDNLLKVKALGVDVTALFDSVLSDLLENTKCPTCGQKITSKKG